MLFYHIKQLDSILPWVCTVIDHRLHHQWYTQVTYSAVLRVPLFHSFLIWTSSVIYYRPDVPHHRMYLLNRVFSYWAIRSMIQYLQLKSDYCLTIVVPSHPLPFFFMGLMSTFITDCMKSGAYPIVWKSQIITPTVYYLLQLNKVTNLCLRYTYGLSTPIIQRIRGVSF